MSQPFPYNLENDTNLKQSLLKLTLTKRMSTREIHKYFENKLLQIKKESF